MLSDFNVTRFEKILRNGIRVVLLRRPGAPIATDAVLRSGSKYDPDHMPGLSHFIEHLIMNGSAKFPSKNLLAEHIESVGGSYGARTGQDVMTVGSEVPDREDYSRVVDIYTATLCEPLLDKKAFENEKNVIIKEIQKADSNPSQILMKTARHLFLHGTPFEHPVLGDEESIARLNYEEVLSEREKLFDASRVTFVVSGDISIEELYDHLDTLPFAADKREGMAPENVVKPETRESVLATFFDAPQTYLCLGVASAPSSFTKEFLHLGMLGDILAGGRAARLTKRLRYDKGLVYSVSFSYFGGLTCRAWGIMTDTSENKVQDVVSEIVEEIKNIRKNGVTELELEFIKSKRIKSLKRVMQTSGDWVGFYNVAEACLPGQYGVDIFERYVKEASLQDINRVIDVYLQPAAWKLAFCGRTKKDDVLLG